MPALPLLPHAQYNALWAAEHLAGPLLGADRVSAGRRRVNRRIAEHLVRTAPERELPEPDRVAGIGPRDFRRRYLETGTPVILEGLASTWPSHGKWSPAWFGERYPDYELTVSTDRHADRGGWSGTMPMAEYVARIHDPEVPYARVQPILHEHRELLEDLDMPGLMRFKRRRDRLVATQFFMGPPTSHTVLHCAFINNLFVQVHGEKDWLIFPADYTQLFMPPVDRAPTFRSDEAYAEPDFGPGSVFRHIRGWRFTLRPGDVLFNPAFAWHHVLNRTPTISVSCRIWSLQSALRASPMLTAATALATRPPALAGLFAMVSRGGNFQNFYAQG